MKSISVIIPNYNGKELFQKYLLYNLSIFESLKSNIQIIVVDDASTDGSVEYLKENFNDKITLIEKKENTGFAQTCNLGIQMAHNELTFLLNTDVQLSADYFNHLFKYFESPDTFGVMGRIIGMNDDVIQESARCPKIIGRKIKPSNFFYLKNESILTPTFYLSGAIALMDTEKLKEINGFNELFNPFYSEDQELCIRAWRLGWKCYYEHNAICRHEVAASTKNHSSRKKVKELYFRNRYYVHYLHLYGFDLLLWHLQVIFSDVLMAVFTFQTYKVSAYLSVFTNRKKLNRKKRAFKQKMINHSSKLDMLDVIHKIRFLLKDKRIIKL